MKLKINKACDIASISVLPPRRTGGSSGGGGGMSAPAAASAAAAAQQQRSQSMSQKSFSQGIGNGGASFSQARGASFSQGSDSGGAAFSQVGGGGGAAFSQGGGSGGAAFSQGGGGGGAAFSQGGGGGGAAFSQGGGGGGAAFSQGGGSGGATFSQGGGSGGASFSQGGGSAPLVHAQSQLSQASLDANLLSLLSQAPARDQDSSKRTSSYPASSASCVREESQLQLTKIPTNPIHRWCPSLLDSRCQVNEEVERKFQHLASSVHKMGMILDSVQNDVMQLNRAMKEASLDSGSIQKKFVLLEDSLKQILKGQDDLRALLEGITESNPDQVSVLNSLSSKQDEMSLLLSVLPNHVQRELGQLKGDISRIFSKEMEVMVRAVRSVDTRLDQMQMLANQSCTTNAKPLMNQTRVANGSSLMMQTPVAYGSPLMNQTPVADGGPLMNQGPVADGSPLMNQGPVAEGRPRKKQRPAANGRPQRKKLTPVANGRPQRKKQRPVANGRPQRNQRPVPNGRPQVQTADGSSHMNQKPEANGNGLMNQVLPVTQAASAPAPLAYQRKTEGVKPNVEKGMVKAATEARKLDGSGDSRPAPPKEQELAIQKDNADAHAPINKAIVTIVIDSDEEAEEGSASCVMLKTGAGGAGEGEALEILRRARKRRRREEANAVALDHC
ncbi:hypothetical protein CFC21_063625 [Triticum aestivum]|uniref:Uncharacterized protein n=4 Tax=Triticinae TaxID=1648030 RepID=A0A3B6JQ00_WHEAT|nr:hypothetical protein CFC21_063625 [Triticum aestivum]